MEEEEKGRETGADLQVTSTSHSRRREGALTNPHSPWRGETRGSLGPALLPSLAKPGNPGLLVLNLWLTFAESIFGKLRGPGGGFLGRDASVLVPESTFVA